MRAYSKILLIAALFLLVGNSAFGQEEELGADFSYLKGYKGTNYTITYPGKGYEEQLAVLIRRVNKIIPFIESYGSIKFQNIQINIIKDSSGLGGSGALAGTAEFLEEKVNIPAAYYNENVVVHELCHLAQNPLIFPPWFGEGHAESCARKYYESVGEYDRVKIYDEFYGGRAVELKNVRSDVPGRTSQELEYSLPPTDERAKTALDSYLLIKELIGSVSMAKILPKMRQDFVVDEGGIKKPYGETLPNDAIICKINEVAAKDVSPIFEKYGFKIGPCSEKTYDFLKPSAGSSLSLVLISLIFLGLIIAVIVFFVKRRRAKLKKS